uniref:Uncharacterized protein n=1 Tax=Ignavibacterium album TaxID=591197 RepID=A0A832G8G7_9BACT
MKFKVTSIFILLLHFIIFNYTFLIEAKATIRYVSKTGSSTPPYTSWSTAADSIQKCINISQAGDTIYVANGVYRELITMIPGLSLIGAGMDSCIVDTRGIASSYYDGVIVKDSCLFKGFQVIATNQIGNGIKAQGQAFISEKGLITMNKVLDGFLGIYLFDSDITVKNNICLNNGRGIVVDYSNSLVSENFISSNYEGGDRGIEVFDLAHLYSPIITNNYIETNLFGITSILGPRSLTITNNIVVVIDPEGGWGINIGTSADTAKVFNNLIMAKEFPTNLGGIGISNPPRYVYNNLIFGNAESDGTGIGINGTNLNLVKILNNLIVGGQYGIYSDNNPSGTVPAYYNNIWMTDIKARGFTLDSTNISVDPMFVNEDTTQGQLDFHLQMFSPLIDAGDPSIADLDGTRSDIGLYGGPFGERYFYQDLPPKAPVNLSAIVDDSGIIKLRWNRNTEADTSYYNIYRSTTANFTIDSTKLIGSTKDTSFINIYLPIYERLYYKITCLDRQGNQSQPSEELLVNLTSISEYPTVVNDYYLYQNYPNPFNPSTKIGYKLKERGYVKLYVYDVKGEVVAVLVNQEQEAGYYEVEFNAVSGVQSVPQTGIASGIYIYQIMVRSSEGNIPVFTDSKKMIYIK